MDTKEAYESGRQDALTEAIERVKQRFDAASLTIGGWYQQGLHMALNDLYDLKAGGRLTEVGKQ